MHPTAGSDLNAEKYGSKERLVNLLESQFEAWEAEYGVTEISRSCSIDNPELQHDFCETLTAFYIVLNTRSSGLFEND